MPLGKFKKKKQKQNSVELFDINKESEKYYPQTSVREQTNYSALYRIRTERGLRGNFHLCPVHIGHY